jgi:hypothetical protein
MGAVKKKIEGLNARVRPNGLIGLLCYALSVALALSCFLPSFFMIYTPHLALVL